MVLPDVIKLSGCQASQALHYTSTAYLVTQFHLCVTVSPLVFPAGVCALSPSSDHQILVFPGHKQGSIQIPDLSVVESGFSSSPVTINAHQGEIQCIAINQEGTRVATASSKVTEGAREGGH